MDGCVVRRLKRFVQVTCSTALVLPVLSVQDQTKYQQQQQNQTAQCQHDEKPPLLIKRGVQLGCLGQRKIKYKDMKDRKVDCLYFWHAKLADSMTGWLFWMDSFSLNYLTFAQTFPTFTDELTKASIPKVRLQVSASQS